MQRLATDIPQSNKSQWQVMRKKSLKLVLKFPDKKNTLLLKVQKNNFNLHVLRKLKGSFPHKFNKLNTNLKFQYKSVQLQICPGTEMHTAFCPLMAVRDDKGILVLIF